MAKSVVRVGDIGTGGVAKLVNNMIVGAAFSIIAEGFALAMKNGIDPQVLYEAIKDGWAGSTVLNVAAPGIIKQDYKPGGTIDLLFKDIGYALSLARSQNVPVPVTAIVDEVFKTARASGRGPYAQQIITQMWENLLEIDRG
jgi:2-hydroxy-3-oxopropionate reductase